MEIQTMNYSLRSTWQVYTKLSGRKRKALSRPISEMFTYVGDKIL